MYARLCGVRSAKNVSHSSVFEVQLNVLGMLCGQFLTLAASCASSGALPLICC